MKRSHRATVVVVVAALAAVSGSAAARPAEKAPADYSEVAERLVGAALVDGTAAKRLEWLSDRIGNRLSGSPALDQAIEWAVSEMRNDGLENVHKEKVLITHWVRGEESGELVEPVSRKLSLLGLGNSVGTPSDGITADVAVVTTWGELEALGDSLRGKIVLFDVPYTGYGQTVAFRFAGPSRAAKHGAVATLVRSITPYSLRTPHTGTLVYDEDLPKIPAAAITIEDAELISRCVARGERVRVHLKMDAKLLPDVESANVVAEVRGSEHPDEVVVMGGHLDSWDVGQGSNDDGGGCVISWEALRLVKRLGLRPRRTLRVVLWVNEENGTKGGKGYRDAHASDLDKHVLAIETDSGIERPHGFRLTPNATARSKVRAAEIGKLLRGLGASMVESNGGGADISPLVEKGVLGMSLDVDESRYFYTHHTQADTFDKIDRTNLGLCTACMAVMGFVAADLPDRLDQAGGGRTFR